MATLLKDVIHIPEELSANDFVLKLSDGVTAVEETLASYVVTPQLAEAFDAALSYIKGALEKGRSDAAFLHGSFGSGKSHFMSVLHAVLQHNPHARRLDGLAPVIAKHDHWLSGRRILCLTYHLIGAESVEAAILGGYLEQIRRLHPDAPLPELHTTDGLLADADRLRERLGDEAFFAGLGGGGAQPGWGTLAAPWTADSYERARNAPIGDPERGRLVSALVNSYFSGYVQTGAYLALDQGLEVVSAHAKQLGYDCVVLFLDELVLWLASRSSDVAFVSGEGAKVAKLVESAATRRAVPLVSFVARQRDLRDFLGPNVPGAEKYAIGETFRWWEDRFNKITLEDRNLPVIVKRRLLQPKPGAEGVLEAAFRKVTREPKIWNVLLEGLDESSDADAFERTYPFSPALVSTMVALSSLLQRERTALRTMAELLRRGRDELTVDDIIPVGDVYDVLMDSGVVPLTDEMKQRFANARALYEEKLLPRLLDRHRLATPDHAKGLPRTHPFVTDARLVKTALLAALAPNVPALRALTAQKLAALNHGTIATPLKGMEAARVLALFRDLAASGVSEIHLSDDPANPLISIQLAGVDYERVLDRVRHQDSKGERRRLLRELVFESLGVTGAKAETLGGAYTHSFVWRGTRRTVDIVYGNIRNADELPNSALMAEGDRWKIIIDFPFDEAGHGPNDDIARFENLQREGVRSRTVAWVPQFLTEARENDLGELVCLRYLLASDDRYEQNASDLSVQDRATAKVLLLNRKSTLETKLNQVIQQAYGAAKPEPADIDLDRGHSAYFATLEPGLELGAPVGARLADCLEHLLDQILSAQYPDHPNFPGEVRRSDLTTVLRYLELAAAEESGRIPVDPKDREVLRKVANPLQVGEALENAFLFTPDTFPWRKHLMQRAAQEGLDQVISVGKLIEWLDEPRPRGLDAGTRGLVIAAFALMEDREWYRAGERVPMPSPERIDASYELRLPRLPDDPTWRRAVGRAARIFEVHVTGLKSAANVRRLATEVRDQARRLQEPARRLVTALESRRGVLALPEDGGRLATARSAATLAATLAAEPDPTTLAEALANAPLAAGEEVLGYALRTAGEVLKALDDMDWGLLDAIASIGDDPRAADILDRLRAAAGNDEFAECLAPALARARRTAQMLLASRVQPQPGPGTGPEQPITSATLGAAASTGVTATAQYTAQAIDDRGAGGRITVPGRRIDEAIRELRAFAAAHPDTEITVTWSERK